MSTITLPNIRVSSDLTIRLKLKDGGVAIDWSTLQNIRVSLYADDQRSMASRCNVSIDEEDSTILVCQYAANKMQYLGVNRVIVQCKYMGEVKTYDKPAFNFVRWTSDQEGEQITIDDPDVDVEISVEDVSSSILQEAVDAAFGAADRANEAAEAAEHMVDIHTGPEGKSAYEVAVEEGYTGTEEEWLASLVGPQGAQGIQGETGEAAGFGSVSAALQEDGGDPSVVVAASGEDTSKNFAFTFKNLKGDKGDKGDQGNTGSSVDYPYELVNNCATDDATKGLSAAQGVVLDGKVSQLEAEVGELVAHHTETINKTGDLAVASSGQNVFLYDINFRNGRKYTITVETDTDNTGYFRFSVVNDASNAVTITAANYQNLNGNPYTFVYEPDEYFGQLRFNIRSIATAGHYSITIVEEWDEVLPSKDENALYVSPGKNLADPAKFLSERQIAAVNSGVGGIGMLSSVSAYSNKTTGYIKIKNGETLVCNTKASSQPWNSAALFKVPGDLMSIPGTYTQVNFTDARTITNNLGYDAYAVFNLPSESQLGEVMVEVGSSPSAYVEYNALYGYTPKDSLPKSEICYISPSGDDDNNGLSAETPVQTFARAKELLDPDGTLYVLEGDYERVYSEPLFDLSDFASVKGIGKVRLIQYEQKISSAELVSGYTRVYSVEYTGRLSSQGKLYSKHLYQHDIPDADTLILDNERHPLQSGKTYRIPSTRIYPAESISQIEETTTKPMWYYDGETNILYFSIAEGSSLATNPVYVPRYGSLGASKNKEVNIENLNFEFVSIKTQNLTGVFKNCSCGMTSGTGSFDLSYTSLLRLVRCEAFAADNDGFNTHNADTSVLAMSTIIFESCWAHDCSDDGESCHESSLSIHYGGLYEYNGNGITPALGAGADCYGSIVRRNGVYPWTSERQGTGFSAQGAGAVITCHDCVAENNAIVGYSAGGNTHGVAYNCIAKGNTMQFSPEFVQVNCVSL